MFKILVIKWGYQIYVDLWHIMNVVHMLVFWKDFKNYRNITYSSSLKSLSASLTIFAKCADLWLISDGKWIQNQVQVSK